MDIRSSDWPGPFNQPIRAPNVIMTFDASDWPTPFNQPIR